MKKRYVFGPIVSRRFGYSLGIDLSPDEKSCNFDCIYCELESSKSTNRIKNPPIIKDIIKEVENSIENSDNIDVITITSNGEPTLFENLDILIDELNHIKRDKKLLILSNASTIMKKEIQHSLKKLDIVKLSLDSTNKITFKKIDRAYKGIEIDSIIKGIKEFRAIFDKELIIEILVVKGINDNIEEIQRLNEVLNEIKPNRVDFGTIDRPPAYRVEPVSMERLKELSSYFSNITLNITYKRDYKQKKLNLTSKEILSTIKRRPLSQEDVNISFDDKTKEIFDKLLLEKKIQEIQIAGVKFFRV